MVSPIVSLSALLCFPCIAFISIGDRMAPIKTVDLFCQVIDNFGDIGVSWRLARQLTMEFGLDVTLWVDDLHSFRRICRAVDPARSIQHIDHVSICHWNDGALLPARSVGDLIIEAFGCRLPESFLARMAACNPKPRWINLEYLSAESWVDGCHAMASPHPQLPLTKYFFFPGFSENSGGLLIESGLAAQRNAFQADAVCQAAFLEELVGWPCDMQATRVSLFCYPDAPVEPLFRDWQQGSKPVVCLVPEGVATTAVQAFLRRTAASGAHARQGNLSLHVIPFLDQPSYDRLLWACDVNFVRGEDSFVRAQWAQKPFAWQIYPQDQNAHLVKLDAFLDRYVEGLSPDMAAMVRSAWHGWNGHGAFQWDPIREAHAELDNHASRWARALSRRGDLATNIISFAGKIG